MSDKHENPQNDYERMLERNGLDCSRYGCWQPIAAITRNRHGERIGVCRKHAQVDIVEEWLET